MRKQLAKFQKDRLTQARHSQKLSMSELAEKVGLTRQAISSFEKGDTNPSPNTLRDLATILKVNEIFLTNPLRAREAQLESAISFRTVKASTKMARLQAKVFLDWTISFISYLESYITLPTPQLPDFNIGDFLSLKDDDIDDLAEKTRRYFGLGDGPISDLTLLMENKGVIISHVPLAEKMDGLSAWYGGHAVVAVNHRAKAVRIRFDLAHELAHLILHKSAAQEDLEDKRILNKMESDANRFAGAFLLPERSITAEIYSTDIESLKNVKKRWGVSIQAIVYRLADIGVISEHQKSRFFQRFSMLGMRKKEPLDDEIQVEKPRLFRKVIEFLDAEKVISPSDVLHSARLPEDFLSWVTNLEKNEFRSELQLDNVVQFMSRGNHSM